MGIKAIISAIALLPLLAGCDKSATEPSPWTGRMTITFDDGWTSAYTRGLPTLRQHGLHGNLAVVTESVDSFAGFVTLPQLREMRNAGWSIVSHSVSHPRLTTLSDAELERQLTESKAWIAAQGFPGSSVFVVPYHEFGERELAAIRRHYRAARIANANFFSPAHFESWRPADPYKLTAIEAGRVPYTTPVGRDALIAQVEAALTAGKFVDVMFHDITAAEYDAFQQTIARLARFKRVNAPYHELFGS